MIPNIESIDKVSTQWLYLNLLNTVSLLIIILKRYSLKKHLFNRSTYLFFSLFIWSFFSLFFAINKSESIVVLAQIFAIVISFIILKICIGEIEKPLGYISNIISIFLIVELAKIYFPFTELEIAKSKIFSRSPAFLGFAANVNITAFSTIYKIPFLIYSIIQLKKFKHLNHIFAFIIFFLISFAAGTLNSTRGAILVYSSLIPILLVIGIIVYIKSKNYRMFILASIYTTSILLSFSLNNYLTNSITSSNKSITNRISSLNALIDDDKNIDQSLNQRLNFYSQSAKSIIKNPIFGVGIGNWKIKSIDTDKDNIEGYIVPYHVHNDYLEIGAEIGLVGLSIYLIILFFSFKTVVFKFLKMIFTRAKLEENYIKYIIISLFFYIYLIDSNINFPFHRPIVLINLIVLLAFLNKAKSESLNEKG